MSHYDCQENGNGPCEGEVFERVPEGSFSGMAYPWCDRHWDIKNEHYWQVRENNYRRASRRRR